MPAVHSLTASARAAPDFAHPSLANRARIETFDIVPDGKAIVFSKGPEGGNIDLWTMRIDGSHITRLTRSPLWQSAPAWGPRQA